MENLITQILCIPTLKSRNVQEFTESSALTFTRGKGGCGTIGGHGDRECPQCTYCKRMGHTQENCYSLHVFLDMTTNISKYEVFE